MGLAMKSPPSLAVKLAWSHWRGSRAWRLVECTRYGTIREATSTMVLGEGIVRKMKAADRGVVT